MTEAVRADALGAENPVVAETPAHRHHEHEIALVVPHLADPPDGFLRQQANPADLAVTGEHGLDTHESARLGDTLRTIADSGITILLVDHDTALVFDVSDRVYVLDVGTVIACGTPDEIRKDPAVVAAYLGAGAVSWQTRGGE